MDVANAINDINRKLDLIMQGNEANGDNHLLNVRQVLSELGLKADDKAWGTYKKILQEKYGMQRLKGTGLRIRRGNLKKFLADHYI